MTIALHCPACGTLSEVRSHPPVTNDSAKRYCPSCGGDANLLESTNVFDMTAALRNGARRGERTG